MFSQVSYNVVVERFKAFASGHYLIKRFSHGQIDVTDIMKDAEYPWMHIVPVSMNPSTGIRSFSFDIIFADLPRDKEDKTEYQRESLSDCMRLAEDLLAEIQNGNIIFGEDVELEQGASISPFMEEYTHVLTGVTLSLTITFPWDWNACEIPADWSAGGSGSGGTGGGGGVSLILKVNNVENNIQTILNIVQGANMNIIDLGDGRVQFDATGDIGTTWGTIGGLLADQTDLQDALDLKVDIISLAAVATSGNYLDLSNLPSIPTATSELTNDSGFITDADIPVRSLQDVTDVGNDTTNNIDFVGDAGAFFDNGSRVTKGTTDAGTGGSKGVALRCSLDYQLKWEAGRLYVMEQNGIVIREVSHNFTFAPTVNDDSLKGFVVDSRWILDNGDIYVCTDATIGAAVWILSSGFTQVNSDWNATSGVEEILNKPTIPDELRDLTDVNISSPVQNDTLIFDAPSNQFINGQLGAVAYSNDYGDLDNLPTIPAAQIQSDWTQTNTSALDYIKNKPTIPAVIGDMTKAVYDTNNDGVVDFAQAVKTKVRNSTGAVLHKGHIVYLSGSTGNLPNARYAQANNDANSAQTFGVVYADIANNSDGFVVMLGGIDTLDTRTTAPNPFTSDTLVDGQVIYLSPTTAGHITNVKPVAPNHMVYVGYVIRTSPTNGTIMYRMQNGYELDELHDVQLPSPASNDYLYYDGATSLWKSKQLVASAITDSTTTGRNVLTIPNPSAISYLRINADNSVTARTPAQVLTDLGISSSIILGRDMVGASVVNTTANTLVFNALIPANTLQASDFIELISQFQSSVGNGVSIIWRTYLNTTPTIGGTLLATWQNAVGTGNTGFLRNIFISAIGASGNLRITGTATTVSSPYTFNSAVINNVTINTTIDQYIVIGVQMGNAITNATILGTILRLTR